MSAHRIGVQFGLRWCFDCDTAAVRCRAQTIPPESCAGIEIRSETYGCWIECPCGVIGPKHHGDPDDAWQAADDDRARHLAGVPLDLDLTVGPPAAPVPTHEPMETLL